MNAQTVFARLLLFLLVCVHERSIAASTPSGREGNTQSCPSGFQPDGEEGCRAEAGTNSHIVNLDPYALEDFVLKHQVVMVSFCTADDGKCRLLGPEMARAASEAGSTHTGAKFVNVDVAKHSQARVIYGITAVPTLRFFISGRMQDEDYTGRRLADDLLQAARERDQKTRTQEPAHDEASPVVELSAAALQKITHTDNDINLYVLFYTSTCAALSLELEAVARTFKAHKNITVAKLDVLQYPAAFQPYVSYGTPLMVGGKIHIHVHVTCTCVHIHMHVCMHAHMHIRICMYVYTHTHIHTHMHTHMHTHTHTHRCFMGKRIPFSASSQRK